MLGERFCMQSAPLCMQDTPEANRFVGAPSYSLLIAATRSILVARSAGRKLRLCRYSRNSGSDTGISVIPRGEKVFQILTIRSEFGYGSGRKSTESTTLKTAVVAPMPRARVAITANVKTGLRRSQ